MSVIDNQLSYSNANYSTVEQPLPTNSMRES